MTTLQAERNKYAHHDGNYPRYRLLYRQGLLTIQYMETGKTTCSLHLANGHTLSTNNDCRTQPEQLLLPFPKVNEAQHFLLYSERIASRATDIINRIPIRRETLLDFCLKGGTPALELLESSPALTLLLALRIRNDPSVGSVVVRLLASRRRVEILRYCAYPAEKWIVRLLASIPAVHCSPYILHDLKFILKRNRAGDIKTLRHLSLINRLVVSVLKNVDNLSTRYPKFLSQCGNISCNRFRY